MHIIIAVITAIAGLIWALNSLQRSGFDLNSLNPFYWMRRKRWAEKQINPLYAVDTPRELVALLMFAVQRQSGDPTEEQKANMLGLFQSELKFDAKSAGEMYLLASHLLSTDLNYMHKVPELTAPGFQTISQEQLSSVYGLVERVATFSSIPNANQTAFLDAVAKAIEKHRNRQSW